MSRDRFLFVILLALAATAACKTVYDDEPLGSSGVSGSSCPFDGATVREEFSLTTTNESRCAQYVPVLQTWAWHSEAALDADIELYSANFDGFVARSCEGVLRSNQVDCTARTDLVCSDGTIVQENSALQGSQIVGTRTQQSPAGFTCEYAVVRTPL